MGKTNGLLKFQPYPVSTVEVIVIDYEIRKTIDLYMTIWKNNIAGTHVIHHELRVQEVTELGLVLLCSP